ncbi:hypothetical protein L7F22_042457 [Adiantum nelumboides]|nr:hypothetical protein [Adiantum nelumboides]
MSNGIWNDLDKLARSTIMLTLSKRRYFNVKDMRTTYDFSKKLCNLYEKKRAALEVYWLKQLVDLEMKEGTTMPNHLNEFNVIFNNLSAHEVEFEDSNSTSYSIISVHTRLSLKTQIQRHIQ